MCSFQKSIIYLLTCAIMCPPHRLRKLGNCEQAGSSGRQERKPAQGRQWSRACEKSAAVPMVPEDFSQHLRAYSDRKKVIGITRLLPGPASAELFVPGEGIVSFIALHCLIK